MPETVIDPDMPEIVIIPPGIVAPGEAEDDA